MGAIFRGEKGKCFKQLMVLKKEQWPLAYQPLQIGQIDRRGEGLARRAMWTLLSSEVPSCLTLGLPLPWKLNAGVESPCSDTAGLFLGLLVQWSGAAVRATVFHFWRDLLLGHLGRQQGIPSPLVSLCTQPRRCSRMAR